MKIFYIVNARIPTEKAHGYQICKMCEAFVRKNIDLKLIVPHKGNSINEDVFDFYRIEKKFKIEYLRCPSFLRYGKVFSNKLAWHFQNFYLYFKLFFYKTDKDNLIYTRNFEIAWIFKLKGYKVFLELHSLPKNKIFIFKYFVKKVDKIIVITKGLKANLSKIGIADNKILVAPDAVDLQNFDIKISKEEARKHFSFPNNKILLGYSGSFKTMAKDKGISDILKALKIVLETNDDVFFVAIGGSPDDIIYYSKQAQELGIEKNVLLLERVNIELLAKFQKAMDILLMPYPYSKHYAEYMSALKMFEYMASGRPIIASDLPSIREVLNEKNCLFCKPDNPNDLAQKIIYLIKNQETARLIAEKAYIDVRSFTWNKRAENILKSST